MDVVAKEYGQFSRTFGELEGLVMRDKNQSASGLKGYGPG
jgi:hypothetical protein